MMNILGTCFLVLLASTFKPLMAADALWSFEIFQRPERSNISQRMSQAELLKQQPKIARKDFETECSFVGRKENFPAGDGFASTHEEVTIVCKRKDMVVRSGPAKCIYFDLKSNPKADPMVKILVLSHQRLNAETELSFEFPGSDQRIDLNSEILTVRVRCWAN